MSLINDQIVSILRLGVYLLMGTGVFFLGLNVIKAIYQGLKEKRELEKKDPKAKKKLTRKEKEMNWKISEMENARRRREYQPNDEHAKRREREEQRELYRMKRKENQWRK